jgi:broad specificity phosphatase PhoE
MRLIITRHGETEENKRGIIQGQLQGTLTTKGIWQAKKLAKRLQHEKIDYIYSSDLLRSVNTAKEIHKYHLETPIEFISELRERYFADLQGKTKKEAGVHEQFRNIKEKNVETPQEIQLRARNILQKLLKKHPYDSILIVGHGAINMALIGTITKEDEQTAVETLEIPKNTSVYIFEINQNTSHKTYTYNCIKHLNN